MEIHVDYTHPSGACFMVGPFRVEQTDYGVSPVESGGGIAHVYRERLVVKAYGKVFEAWSEVDRRQAELGPKSVGRMRAEGAIKALESIVKQIDEDRKKAGR